MLGGKQGEIASRPAVLIFLVLPMFLDIVAIWSASLLRLPRGGESGDAMGLRWHSQSGQGVFFGLGGYCMAMFLKLEASSPENTAIQSTPGIPDFMDWNQLTQIPWFWEPFNTSRSSRRRSRP